jgi:hypothetical protein
MATDAGSAEILAGNFEAPRVRFLTQSRRVTPFSPIGSRHLYATAESRRTNTQLSANMPSLAIHSR